MKIRLKDGPCKGQVINLTDNHIGNGWVQVVKPGPCYEPRPDGSVIADSFEVYTYYISRLYINGIPGSSYNVYFTKPELPLGEWTSSGPNAS